MRTSFIAEISTCCVCLVKGVKPGPAAEDRFGCRGGERCSWYEPPNANFGSSLANHSQQVGGCATVNAASARILTSLACAPGKRGWQGIGSGRIRRPGASSSLPRILRTLGDQLEVRGLK